MYTVVDLKANSKKVNPYVAEVVKTFGGSNVAERSAVGSLRSDRGAFGHNESTSRQDCTLQVDCHLPLVLSMQISFVPFPENLRLAGRLLFSGFLRTGSNRDHGLGRR